MEKFNDTAGTNWVPADEEFKACLCVVRPPKELNIKIDDNISIVSIIFKKF